MYREDPQSVDERTREFFETWSPPTLDANGRVAPAATASGVDVEKIVGMVKYFRAIWDFGHRAARLDPLGMEPPGDPTLDPGFHDTSEEELEALPANITNAPGTGPIPERTSTAREAIDELRRLYCKTTGYDFGHIHTAEERFWLRDAVESERYNRVLEGDEAITLLKNLTRVDTLEKSLHRAFLGQKRFSVEGVDMVVPMLRLLTRFAAEKGTPEVVLGMAHRGRLNVLAHVLDKPYSTIFGEFQQPDRGESSPVSESPGEGWVGAVTLNLSRLPGYKTGGTVHIITNNQLGFTTEKEDARSTTYAGDLAKGYEIPVVHVNADDPEACLAAVRLAYAYREEFRKDFMIDLIGYRRYG